MTASASTTPTPGMAALEELAGLHGVATAYVDVDGRRQQADPAALVAVLGALDVPTGGPEDAVDAVRAERLRRHTEVLAPAMTLPAGPPPPLVVSLPQGVHPRDCWLTLEVEGREPRRTRLLPAIGRPLGTDTLEGRRMDRYEVKVAGGRPLSLPTGYHRLTVEGPDVAAETLVLVAPTCPAATRGWGAFLPLHALRTDGDWGVGSYPDLAELAGWVGELGGDVVGTLPLYPALLDGPVEPSPYLPASRLGWNELYVDPTVLPELAVAPAARHLLASEAFAAELAAARRSPAVDHRAVLSRLRRVLAPMAEAVFAAPSARRDELEAFARAHPELVAYARFRGAAAPAPPDEGPVAAEVVDAGRAEADEGPVAGAAAVGDADRPAGPAVDLRSLGEGARYHLYVQWVADQQLAAAGDRLYLDLPVGVHPDGFDPRWEPRSFASGAQGGAPPDAFFSGGQQWGFRPLHPRGLRQTGYRHLVACLRHAMGRAAVLRIDHVMGLRRLYWVPDGFDARHGVYVRYPHEELRAVVCLEADRAGTVVVGEDLGTVPPEVRQAMAQDGMLRSWVLQFEAGPDDPFPEPPEPVVASLGTHDLPRFAAYWDGEDVDERWALGEEPVSRLLDERFRRDGWRHAVTSRLAPPWAARQDVPPDPLGDTEDPAGRALRACLGHLAGGPARLLLVDLEDLWLERRPQNRPGTGPEAGNWQQRAARTLDEARHDPAVVAALAGVDRLRRGTQDAPAGADEAGGGGAAAGADEAGGGTAPAGTGDAPGEALP